MAKILLIDDDRQLLNVMTSFLEREQHEISTAADGKQGIKQLKAQQFDLVITDVIMPEEDGLGVLMWLMNQSHRPKVIAISGGSVSLDQDHLLSMCKQFSADKVLPKPVEFETFTSAVRDVLKSVHG
jgi:DNA-binding response OmpR family regulator